MSAAAVHVAALLITMPVTLALIVSPALSGTLKPPPPGIVPPPFALLPLELSRQRLLKFEPMIQKDFFDSIDPEQTFGKSRLGILTSLAKVLSCRSFPMYPSQEELVRAGTPHLGPYTARKRRRYKCACN
jgi:hypothetical protein